MENPNLGHSMEEEGKLKIEAGGFYRPKDDYGEDAYFLDVGAQVIGIADGVGGWCRRGIDAGEYARQLMENAAEAVKGCAPNQVNPMEVLVKAHQATVAEGSSTACILCFDGHLLQSANLGDSGFLVLRRKRVVYKSNPQQHRFNHPYQMGKMCGTDAPDAAEEGKLLLKRGDAIVAGTDGLWDNLHVEKIHHIMRNNFDMISSPESMAKSIAMRALTFSRKENYESPFQRDAMKAGVRHSGGKPDDITVVVAYVVQAGSKQAWDEDGDT